MIYSFDIFDTVLVRTVGEPMNVFLLMQKEISHQVVNFPDEFINDFKDIRMEVESSARIKYNDKEDVTFDQIYQMMKECYAFNDEQIAYLKRLELETEYKVLRPVDRLVKEIDRLRKMGNRIIFTSDMYLPLEQIKGIFKKVGIYQKNDKIYVSNEIGLTKGTGNLFWHILKEEGCCPCELTHYGDNPISDFLIPLHMGIQIYKRSIAKWYSPLATVYIWLWFIKNKFIGRN